MNARIQSIAVSLLTIALGSAWLLNSMDVIPGVNWVWTVGLGVPGLMLLALGGVNRFTIVTGPFLIIASILSVLRQTDRLNVNHEVPILVIVLGVLMLIAQIAPLRTPTWMNQNSAPRR